MVLNYKLTGTGHPIVFLHGMAASLRSWEPFIHQIDPAKYQTLAIDLLGYGHSSKPRNSNYDYGEYVSSVVETIKAAGMKSPVTLVCHSMGALIGLRLAAEHPEMVNKVITYGLPFFPSANIAKREITNSKFGRKLVLYGPTSHLFCTTWCYLLRPISKNAAHLYLKNLPKEVTEDSVLHTWRSYVRSRINILETQNVPDDLKRIIVPVTLIYGQNDSFKNYIEPENLLKDLDNVELKIIAGFGHNLPHTRPDILNSLI